MSQTSTAIVKEIKAVLTQIFFFVPPAIKNNVILSQRLYVLTFLELKESSGFSMNFVFPNNTEARIFFFKWMVLSLAWCLSNTEQVCSRFFPSISRVLPLAMLGLLDYFAFLEVGHFASIQQHPPKPDLECKKMAHPFNLSYNYPPIVSLLARNKSRRSLPTAPSLTQYKNRQFYAKTTGVSACECIWVTFEPLGSNSLSKQHTQTATTSRAGHTCAPQSLLLVYSLVFFFFYASFSVEGYQRANSDFGRTTLYLSSSVFSTMKQVLIALGVFQKQKFC